MMKKLNEAVSVAVEEQQTPLAAAIADHSEIVTRVDKQKAKIEELNVKLAEISAAMDEATTQRSERPKVAGMSIDGLSDYSAMRVALDRKLEALSVLRTDLIAEIKQCRLELMAFEVEASTAKSVCWSVVYEDLKRSLPTAVEYLVTVGLMTNRTFDDVAADVLPDVNFDVLAELSARFGVPA